MKILGSVENVCFYTKFCAFILLNYINSSCSIVPKYTVLPLHLPAKDGGSRSTVVACWTAGQQVKRLILQLEHDSK